MIRQDNGKMVDKWGPGILGIVFGIILGFYAGRLINIIYAPIGLALGIFLGALYNNWKNGRR